MVGFSRFKFRDKWVPVCRRTKFEMAYFWPPSDTDAAELRLVATAVSGWILTENFDPS